MALGILHSAISLLFPSTIMGAATQLIVASIFYSVFKFLHPLFTFIGSFWFRLHDDGGSAKKSFESSHHSGAISEEKNASEEAELVKSEPESEAAVAGPETENVVFTHSEEKKPDFSFTFRFPTFDEFCKSCDDTITPTSKTEIEDELFNSDSAIPFAGDCEYETIPPESVPDSRDEPLVLSQSNSEEDFFTETDHHQSSSDLGPNVGDGFLTDGDFGEKVEFAGDEMSEFESIGVSDDSDGEHEDSDIMNELLLLEEEYEEEDVMDKTTDHPGDEVTPEFLYEQDFHLQNSNQTTDFEAGGGDKNDTNTTPTNGPYDDSEKTRSKDAADTGDSSKLETLWEHQDLIEQLKMELRKVRATGLPTILEESESPKIMEDLKPWKIDERFHREDCMDELYKFYKSYRERMRKFDIFNYQKMYAIGFLQLKDPLESISSPKASGPTLKSLLSQNFWPLKPKSIDSDPMMKFVKEVQSDLEVVYVGQMCLSWEFLHWQYGKALDLWDTDPRATHRYNEVSGEFQQFQVLLQRFIENEHFQGSRVQYYAKQRCLFRNLLQVPVIKEDKVRDRRKGRKEERAEYVISSEMLVEILEESIRIFWRFVRADKDCTSLVVKGHKVTAAQLQNATDLELLIEVKKALQKKERKLKDIIRSGSCILRKFRQYREDDVDQVLYFFSQVDMKLVSRVLNMTRITTDQLVWCHSKLSRISFEDRKIHVEPSFLLFPCQ